MTLSTCSHKSLSFSNVEVRDVWGDVGPEGVCLQESQGNNLTRENMHKWLQKILQLAFSLLAAPVQ